MSTIDLQPSFPFGYQFTANRHISLIISYNIHTVIWCLVAIRRLNLNGIATHSLSGSGLLNQRDTSKQAVLFLIDSGR
ncbi:hypothetical protein QVD99_004241 [Batrachochytrium dendrobatidis]|nr:hypothetical protein QVD99_004241 [Batrachochytrium dendrobatidis]